MYNNGVLEMSSRYLQPPVERSSIERDKEIQQLKLAQTAMSLYTPPFKYDYGYIFDSNGETVADNSCENDEVVEAEKEGNLALRVRGWGRIQYLKTEHDNGDVQDAVGNAIAKALTEYWESCKTIKT